MNTLQEQINQYCRRYKIMGMANTMTESIRAAEQNQMSYTSFLLQLFEKEALHREKQARERQLKAALLPRNNDLNAFQIREGNGLTPQRLNTLRELSWLDQLYNVLLMGPSGVGKSMLAAGLCSDAIDKGYKAYFRTMEQILNMLKMREFTRASLLEYKRLSKAQLLVIDDIMLFPIEKSQAVALFNFINQIYENTSIIITTNKKPTEWADMMEDEVLATALLDRLLFRCEIINLTGKSYRMENRKTIFGT